MEVIYENGNCKLITHDRCVQKYMRSGENIVKYQLTEKLFMNFKRKQKSRIDENDKNEYILKIKEFIKDCKMKNLFNCYSETDIETFKGENTTLMNRFYDVSSEFKEFFGENNLYCGEITTINECRYLIPPNCRFFNKSVEKIANFLLPANEKFDFIIVDPPWNSRYIKRLRKTFNKKSYSMMSNEDILNIPIHKYTKISSIVIIWCTNSQKHMEFIENNILEKWNLKLISIWNWVKLDKCGDTFCSFDGSKKPYEKIYITTHINNANLNDSVEKELFIFSQPSSIHSHKPPLFGTIIDFIKSTLKINFHFNSPRSFSSTFTTIKTQMLGIIREKSL